MGINYNEFINSLKSKNSTYEVLLELYAYFAKYVSYNYDELDMVKIKRLFRSEPLKSFLENNKGNTSLEFKNQIIDIINSELEKQDIKLISENNKNKIFGDWGKKDENGNVITYNLIVPFEFDFYDKDNKMLKRGVCSDFAMWTKNVLDNVGIKCITVSGVSTEEHSWSLVYDDETNEWYNFDMTMVKYFFDGYKTDCGIPTDWIMASNEKMFKMQPSRIVTRYGIDEIGEYNKDNYEDLDEYNKTLLGRVNEI